MTPAGQPVILVILDRIFYSQIEKVWGIDTIHPDLQIIEDRPVIDVTVLLEFLLGSIDSLLLDAGSHLSAEQGLATHYFRLRENRTTCHA